MQSQAIVSRTAFSISSAGCSSEPGPPLFPVLSNCFDFGLVGQRIAHHRILEKLGGGEICVIYKAASSSSSTKDVAACSSAIR